jgi:hypothetical protein
MDDRLLEEMLKEIDAMTNKEYWAFFNESQKLSDFPPTLSKEKLDNKAKEDEIQTETATLHE